MKRKPLHNMKTKITCNERKGITRSIKINLIMEKDINLEHYLVFKSGSGADKEDNNVHYSKIILSSSVDDAKARFISHLGVDNCSFDDFDAISCSDLILKM